jgi:hypothetical protein
MSAAVVLCLIWTNELLSKNNNIDIKYITLTTCIINERCSSLKALTMYGKG